MISSLIRRTVVADQAYAAREAGSRDALAVAFKVGEEWQVSVADGRIVAEGLTKTVALNLMDQTASRVLDHAALHGLLAEATR